jgi:glc operon protein GlcG
MAERAVKEPHVIALPGAFPFEGGLPVVVDGSVIGSIGVTGATGPEDAQVAQAAIDSLLNALGKQPVAGR